MEAWNFGFTNAMEAHTQVALNCGGTLFQVARTTLKSKSGARNFFDGLLEHEKHEKEDPYFIDRDPRLFASVLYFLRTGKLRVEPLFRETDLVDELSFFGIKAPQSAERDKFLTLHVLVWAISECKGGVLTKDFSQGPSPGKDSYVKTVQIDLYGKCGVEAELLEEVARTYPVRNSEGKNPLELKVPNKIANKFSVAVINPSNDVQLCHVVLSFLTNRGYTLLSSHASLFQQIEHIKTESTYDRLEMCYHLQLNE